MRARDIEAILLSEAILARFIFFIREYIYFMLGVVNEGEMSRSRGVERFRLPRTGELNHWLNHKERGRG
jgi:hypothetical protein